MHGLYTWGTDPTATKALTRNTLTYQINYISLELRMETILMLMTFVVLLCYSTLAVAKERPETFWHEPFWKDH